MTYHLILMRHAKSDHDDPSLSDHDRPLAARGIRDAPRMARWLSEQQIVPNRILCSSALRTRQTAELMQGQWNEPVDVVHAEELYLSSPQTMLAAIREYHQSAKRVLVLTHNPGISMLAAQLSRQMLSMPTAAIAALKLTGEAEDPFDGFDADAEVELTHFVSPKTLTD